MVLQDRLMEMYDSELQFEDVRLLTASYSQSLVSRAVSMSIIVNWSRMSLQAL
jgi:hypothetical protein